MKKFYTVIIGTLFAASVTLNVVADSFNQWNYAKEIETKGDSKYKVVTLDEEVYRYASADLSDIRIVDEKGQIVPYFIQNERTYQKSKEEVYSAKEISNVRVKNDTIIDYNVMHNEKNADILVNQLAFSSNNRNFLKNIDILGSHDGIRWDNIIFTQIYIIDNLEKMKIDLSETYKYKYYRVKIQNNLEGIKLNGVQVISNNSQISQDRFEKSDSWGKNIQSKEKQTYINVSNPNRVRIKGIKLDIEGNFKRSYQAGINKSENIFKPISEGFLYNLKFKDINVTDTYIDLSTQPINSDIEIKVNNNDDKSLNIKNINVDYYIDKLIFEGDKASSYKLHFGNQKVQRPLYDIESYRNYIEKENQDECTLGKLMILKNGEAKETSPDYSKIFNIVIVLVSLSLAGLIFTKVRSKAQNNVGKTE